MTWLIAGVVIFNLFMWMIIYYAQQESKRLGVTEYTNKAFYEPVVNSMVIVSLFSLWWIIENVH